MGEGSASNLVSGVESRRHPKEERGPDISVVVLSGNSERYIRRCISSVAAQRGDFTYELILADATSSDYTLDIVSEELARRNLPFRTFVSPGTLWRADVLKKLFAIVDGNYVAFVSGEDEWVRSTKLKEQKDFLDVHKECFGCVSNYFTRHDSEARFVLKSETEDLVSYADVPRLIREKLVWGVSTAMFRSAPLKAAEFAEAFIDHFAWSLSIQLGSSGILGFMPNVMAIRNESGELSGGAFRDRDCARLLAGLQEYNRSTHRKFSDEFQALAEILRAEIAGVGGLADGTRVPQK